MQFSCEDRIEIGQILIGESLCFGALVVQKSSATNTPNFQHRFLN
jgi:hypothetical protein